MKYGIDARKIILFASLAIFAISGVLYLVHTLTVDTVSDTETTAPLTERPGTSFGPTFDAGSFTVNLDRGKNPYSRFLRAGVVLEVDNESTLEELQKRYPQVRDSIITLLRSKREEDFTPEGLDLVRQEIVSGVNNLLPRGKVVRGYFTEFFIQ